jgi:hypothetical protein
MDDLNCSAVPSATHNIDYMAPNVSLYDLYQCWRRIKMPTAKTCEALDALIAPWESKRLENICWRRWCRDTNLLSVILPSRINWRKEEDITALYGPKFGETEIECRPVASAGIDIPRSAATAAAAHAAREDDEYLSSLVESSGTGFLMGSRDSLTSVESAYSFSARAKRARGPAAPGYHSGSLKLALRTAPRVRKSVRFNYVVNSREYVNGMSFDYDFFDRACI